MTGAVPLGGWRAKPLFELRADEIIFDLHPELAIATPPKFASTCTWLRSHGCAAQTPGDQAAMTSMLGGLPDDMNGAFRRFYVWRDAQGVWRARPLPKLTPDEVSFAVRQELEAETRLELAFACTWQRCRRNVHRYLQEYAVERTHRGS